MCCTCLSQKCIKRYSSCFCMFSIILVILGLMLGYIFVAFASMDYILLAPVFGQIDTS